MTLVLSLESISLLPDGEAVDSVVFKHWQKAEKFAKCPIHALFAVIRTSTKSPIQKLVEVHTRSARPAVSSSVIMTQPAGMTPPVTKSTRS